MLDLGYVAGINANHSHKEASAAAGLCYYTAHSVDFLVAVQQQCGHFALPGCAGPIVPISKIMGNKRSARFQLSQMIELRLTKLTLCLLVFCAHLCVNLFIIIPILEISKLR